MTRQVTNQTPPEIAALLARFRRRIRRYVLLEGLALVLVLLSFLFWISLVLDWGHFRLWSLELPVWFRQAFVVTALAAVGFGLSVWVISRQMLRLRTKSLALVLERRFPQLNDRLVTAVELARSADSVKSPLTTSMLNRTLDEVARAASRLELSAVFDPLPLRRAMIAAVVMLFSIGGFAWANQPAIERWTRAYIDLEQEYWNRTTQLTVRVIAQPGDRLRNFDSMAYKHPRGADLTLLVEVPRGKQIPGRVEIEYRLMEGHNGALALMSEVGPGQFRYSISELLDSLEFWVTGGDFINRQAYRVEVVDPPQPDGITLLCDYPDYTGLDLAGADGTLDPDRKLVQGTQVSLPLETKAVMQVDVNKPLIGARIATDECELAISAAGGELTLYSSEGGPQRTVPLTPDTGNSPLAADGLSFQLPIRLTSNAPDELSALSSARWIPISPDALMRIYLEDTDGVTSIEPAQLTINGIVDQPPVVETELRGIGASVTRKAVIPVAGKVIDDYGVVDVHFDFRTDTQEDWQQLPLWNSPEENPRDFRLGRGEAEDVERFELLPLDLTIGRKLTLTVYAEDGDVLNGPHFARGERYIFQIVSDEELLSILYGKELNLRRRFEQIITEVTETYKDLTLHRSRLENAAQLRAEDLATPNDAEVAKQLAAITTAVEVAAERAVHQLLKNHSETRTVEDSFREILEQLINNAVHTRPMVERIEDLILRPIEEINAVDFPRADEAMGRFKLVSRDGQASTVHIDECLAAINTLLSRMARVLDEMKDLVEFHEAVKDLKSIIDLQQNVSDETKAERKRSILNKLKGLDGG
jgi:hypothetical protein